MRKANSKKYIVIHKKNVHGGFFPAVLAGHEALRQLKPISNAINIAKDLGIADPINNFLDSNVVGRTIKNVGSFLKNTLGYGKRKKVIRRIPRRIRGSKTRKIYRRKK